jgi:trk system potassium uptake protein TrkA
MKIIIIGDGKVGYSLAETLSKEEDNDVTIIDKNPEALKKANDYLDVMCIKGNGLSTKVMMEAGVKDTDLLIAATSSDEMNMVCCLTAKKLGAAHTIARIRDPEYANELSEIKKDLGLDMVINPEQAVAGEIARLLRFPSAVNIEVFARGRVELVEISADEGTPVIGMKLKAISNKISSDILIGAVLRDGNVYIPNGEFEIEKGDILYILGKPSSVFNFCKQIGKYTQKIKNVMVVGGGRIAYYLAQYLKNSRIKVKIIEINKERCVELSELLPGILIVNGDGTDSSMLESESLHDMDAFVSLTGYDEENLVAALSAKQYGVNKVVAKITRVSYPQIIKSMGIDNIVNPKIITTNHILRYVRGLKNALGNTIETLYRIIDGKAEAVEFIANESSKVLDIPLKKLMIRKDTLIATIARKSEIIIPHGNDEIKQGDSVIILSKENQLTDLNDILVSGGI